MIESEYYCEKTNHEFTTDEFRKVGKQIEDFVLKACSRIDQCEMCRFNHSLLLLATIGGKQIARVVDPVEREMFKKRFLASFEQGYSAAVAGFERSKH